jgi:DNA mismatch repair protein MutL
VPADSADADGIISVMPETLANKIAAGEVVQRPASVLKELVENALDAGARSVNVQLKEAGSDLVQVTDDGSGMSTEDARRCFQRHATSKVESVDDLSTIRTLGFRGEALASIAAVARVECKTKRAGDDAGTLIRVEGGEVTEERPCAAPNGTTMSVRNLFYNVPARRNFLKTRATELKHLTETFQRLALSHPEVAFSLESDGREMHHLPAARSDGEDGDDQKALTKRIGDLFDEDYPDRLVAVDDSASYVSMRGVVGEPEFTRKGRSEQFLFVNDRYVKSRYLSHAVKAAYGDMLPDGAFPFFALFLDLDPRRVNVNVHPTKAEIKFEDKSGVYGFVKSAVKNALGRAHLTPRFDESDDASDGASGGSERPRSFTPRTSGSGGSERPAPPAPSSRSGSESSSPARPEPPSRRESSSSSWMPAGDLTDRLYRKEDASEETSSDNEAGTFFRQIRDRFILTDTSAGIMLVDPQAAHRRILYEQALDQLAQEAGSSQQLLFPVNVDLSPADRELLDELLPELRALGFELEPMSGRSVAVRGLPADVRVPEGEERDLLEDVLHQFQEETAAPSVSERESLAKSVARRGALPSGASLEPEAMQALVRQLFECEMPYADPEGRATTHKVSVEEIEKWFRTGRG